MSELFDFIESRELRDDAIQRVSTRKYWMEMAESAIEAVSLGAGMLGKSTFTADDVLKYQPKLEECPELRVLGGAFNKLHKEHVIEPTERYVTSTRKKSHGRRKMEWRRVWSSKTDKGTNR